MPLKKYVVNAGGSAGARTPDHPIKSQSAQSNISALAPKHVWTIVDKLRTNRNVGYGKMVILLSFGWVTDLDPRHFFRCFERTNRPRNFRRQTQQP